MRLITLGSDDQGRSYVVSDEEIKTTEAIPGFSMMSLFATTEVPPPSPPRGQGIHDPNPQVPGTVNWMMVDIAPGRVGPGQELHYNTTIELACLLEGTIHYELGIGTVDLAPGDCVAMPGVDHATFAGPEGARMIAISIGMAPFDD